MRKIARATLFVIFLLIPPINSHFSVITEEYVRVIDESFTLKPYTYLAFNFTRIHETDEHEFWYYQRVNGLIQTFFVDETNFNQFRSKQSFFEIHSYGIAFNEYPEKELIGNYSSYEIILQIGMIFLILNNIENYTVSGKCLLRHYNPINNSTGKTREDPLRNLLNNLINTEIISDDLIFLFERLLFFTIIIIAVTSLILWSRRHSTK